jgi:hypothetical protein
MRSRPTIAILSGHNHSNTCILGATHEGFRRREPHTFPQIRLSHSLTQLHQNISET